MPHTSLPLTGERTVPGIVAERYWYLRHEAAYRWLCSTTPGEGAVIVDAGCGEGYGAAMLAAAGSFVAALDYDVTAISHVAFGYPQVAPARANLATLPIGTASADAVVSLQVVEHLWDLSGFLSECHRILRPEGMIAISTPNRPVFSPGLGVGEKPTNPFHVEEFDATQVRGMLARAGFSRVAVHGLHHGQRIQDWEGEHGSVVAAHIEASMTGNWNSALRGLLEFLAVEDFDFGPVDGAQDLIAVGRA